ncbi:MAG: ethanolamine ammonia-lyase subunit EutC [Burkholderiales bacterium]
MARDSIVTRNNWAALKTLTPARIALGRAGSGLPTPELLNFGLAHARARDAVHAALDAEALCTQLRELGLAPPILHSAALDRETYLRRPDLGRRLAPASAISRSDHSFALVLCDGLSALALERHAAPLIRSLIALSPQRWAGAPCCVCLQGRVALGDDAGARFGCQLVVVLIGERPGLSSPDSLGAYLTFAPRIGRTDAQRNCVSNIRPQGLAYEAAARRIDWIAAAGVERGVTGVGLKDGSAGLIEAR